MAAEELFNRFGKTPHHLCPDKRIYPLLLALLAVLLFPIDNLAADSAIGKLTALHGAVNIKRQGAENPAAAAAAGDNVFIGDVLQTGKDSGCQITFIDNSFVNISSETKLRVDQYIYEPDNNRRKVILKVSEGKARFVFLNQKHGNSLIIMEAGNALITAYAADFVVAVSPSETQVAVIQNGVGVKNLNYLIVGEVQLGINQKTVVREKMPPSKPDILKPEQRKAYMKDARHF